MVDPWQFNSENLKHVLNLLDVSVDLKKGRSWGINALKTLHP
jgi:hypothetical protein